MSVRRSGRRLHRRSDRLRAVVVVGLLVAAWLGDRYLPLLPTDAPISAGWVAALPWIATAVGALASWWGSKKNSEAQNKAANQQGELIGLQKDAANRLMPWGEDLMKRGGSALTSLLPWYTKAAYGDRSVLNQLIAPELRQVRENYDQPLMQLSEVSPRTGTTAAGNAQILTKRAEALNNTSLSARLAGMQGLQGIAGQLAGLGSGAVGASFGGLQGASAGNLGMLSQLFNIRQQNSQDSEAIGSSLVDFYKAYQAWNASRQPAGATGYASGGSYAGSGASGGW